MVLQSLWCHRVAVWLLLVLCGTGAYGQTPQEAVSLASRTTYSMAQTIGWLDMEHFLVGRLDGTIAVFRAPKPGQHTRPVLLDVYLPEPGQAVRMTAVKNPRTFVSSGDAVSLRLWRRPPGAAPTAFEATVVPYDETRTTPGVAHRALFVSHESGDFLLTGHELGFVLLWSVGPEDASLKLVKSVDVRLEEPIDYLHGDEPLRHVRGLALWRDDVVLAGAEDGGLHMIRLPDGELLASHVYHPKARLGINAVATSGDYLVVVSCASASDDRNTWLYRLHGREIEVLDSLHLKQDAERTAAVDVILLERDARLSAAVATREGLLWSVDLESEGRLRNRGNVRLNWLRHGNRSDYNEATGQLAVAGAGVVVIDLESGPPFS